MGCGGRSERSYCCKIRTLVLPDCKFGAVACGESRLPTRSGAERHLAAVGSCGHDLVLASRRPPQAPGVGEPPSRRGWGSMDSSRLDTRRDPRGMHAVLAQLGSAFRIVQRRRGSLLRQPLSIQYNMGAQCCIRGREGGSEAFWPISYKPKASGMHPVQCDRHGRLRSERRRREPPESRAQPPSVGGRGAAWVGMGRHGSACGRGSAMVPDRRPLVGLLASADGMDRPRGCQRGCLLCAAAG